MKNIIGSWRFWVILLLALTTLACAGRAERRERKEEAREERRERAEQRRAERVERAEERRASGEPAPMTAAERREAARRERAERRQASREQPQATPVEQVATPTVQTTAAPATQRVAAAPAAAAVADASSKVVFMRVSKQSSGANASLFDVTEPGTPKFIGNVNAGTKISYALNPGIYTFMVVGETAEFMQATIVSGKTYYALVIPRSGAKRFAIEPVRRNEIGGKEFTTWDRGTKVMTDTGTAQGFNAAEVADKRNRYWQEWSKKAAGERAELTINAEDGR